MFRINLKFFTRVFLKDKFFSSLNIFGLALGIAVSILLMLILQNDLNYDKYHENHERIYRIGGHLQATGIDFRGARSARELAPILKEELPEVENFVRAESWDRAMVKPIRKRVNLKDFMKTILFALTQLTLMFLPTNSSPAIQRNAW
jgi:putative ABC transport system permease protein